MSVRRDGHTLGVLTNARRWRLAWLGGPVIGIANGVTARARVQGRGRRAHRASVVDGAARSGCSPATSGGCSGATRSPTTAPRCASAGSGSALTVLFEFGFGRAVDGKSWDALLRDYDLSTRHLWTLVLAWLALGPCVSGDYRITSTVHARPLPDSSTVWPAARTADATSSGVCGRVALEQDARDVAARGLDHVADRLAVLERADADDGGLLGLPRGGVGAGAQVDDQALVGQRLAERVAPQRGQRGDRAGASRPSRAGRPGSGRRGGRSPRARSRSARLSAVSNEPSAEVLVQHAGVDLVRGRGAALPAA